MTTDGYFRAIQEDLTALRRDMVSGFRAVRDEMATTSEVSEVRGMVKDLRADLKIVTDVMATTADLQALREELLREIRDGKHIDELRERLAVVERKLGIEKTRRAG